MPSRIQFYLDEHVHQAVAKSLRQRGIDVVRAQEVGLRGADDLAHFNLARKSNRVLVTKDSDFLRLDRQGLSHSGIVYFHAVNDIGGIVDSLVLIYEAMDPEEMANHIEYW